MLPKRQRLLQVEIKEVLARGRYCQNTFFTIKWLVKSRQTGFKSRQTGFKTALVVSKKVDTRAVVRNHLRRVISGWLKENQDKILPGLWVVIIARPGLANLSRELIRSECFDSFRLGRLLK